VADRALTLIHIFPSFALGGQQRRLAALAHGLGRGFRHKIFALDGDLGAFSLFKGCADRAEAAPFEFRKSRGVDPGNLLRLRALIAGAGGDVLCTYNWGSIEAVMANAAGARLPVVHHEDGFGPDEADGRQIGRRVLTRRFFLKRAFVTVPSIILERIAVLNWKLDPARVVRIPVGVDLAKFRGARSMREGGPVVVGSIGGLRPEKNLARLIRAFEQASAGLNARLVIFGDGPERARLSALAAASPAAEFITLAGPTDRPEEAHAHFDIFAISSDTEQTPTSLIEAMAIGLPAVATAVGDIPAMVSDANRPFVTPPGDEEAFARALRSMMADKAFRDAVGTANAARADAFDAGAMIAAFGALYQRAAGR
jgi:glycosyltransferase involved in cell wall biosynthesis